MRSEAETIPFFKASACGNDFLIAELDSSRGRDLASITSRMCDRHTGIGADGVEWLSTAADVDIRARLFNSDGSEAEISGNGTRCVAAYICSRQAKETVVIETKAGMKTCRLISRSGTGFEFEIAMGQPVVGGELPLHLTDGVVRGIPVSIGNPHYVVFTNQFVPNWQLQASEIGTRPEFKNGVNVELVVLKDRDNLEARFFERGAGETQSSGTGSCAAAVAAISSKRADSPVRIQAPGGSQLVRWDEQIFLTGPAELICHGEFFV